MEEQYSERQSNMGELEGEDEEDMPEEEQFFKTFINENIDNKDPSLGKYFTKIYEEEVPFEIRIEKDKLNQNSIFESLLCKILIIEEINQITNVRIEIACDKDIFFYYTSDISSELFEEIKKKQKLTCKFDNFSDLLIKILDFCIKDTKKYLAVFLIKENGEYKMELLENLEHKFGELIVLDFKPASDDLINKQIIYRYNAMRGILDLAENKISIINGVLKENDPDLIYEVQKNVSKVKVESYLREYPLPKKS